jgi:hypothetical protein
MVGARAHLVVVPVFGFENSAACEAYSEIAEFTGHLGCLSVLNVCPFQDFAWNLATIAVVGNVPLELVLRIKAKDVRNVNVAVCSGQDVI